jgi:hypothetical protein
MCGVATYVLDNDASQWAPGPHLFGCFLDRCQDCGEVRLAPYGPDSHPRPQEAAYLVRTRVNDVLKLNVVYKLFLLSFSQKVLTALIRVSCYETFGSQLLMEQDLGN